ncbi:hypothetical protein [Nocardia niigatensis]|uniref:hypothetical protein n=1 Tax=Nocardia niigatensis TaxID=209249 RepID=UPI0003159BDF|nr:hypothetical protein [Nocardia niigatensis]
MDHEGWYAELRVRTIMAYVKLAKLLSRLDVPIGLAVLDLNHFSIEHYESIAQAQKLVNDAPMSHHLRAALSTACLDWLAAMSLAALTTEEDSLHESEEWLYDAVMLACGRVNAELSLAEAFLDGKIRFDEDRAQDERE